MAFVEELPEAIGLVAPSPNLGGSSNAAKPPAEANCKPVVGGGTALFDHASGLVAAGEAWAETVLFVCFAMLQMEAGGFAGVSHWDVGDCPMTSLATDRLIGEVARDFGEVDGLGDVVAVALVGLRGDEASP